MREKKHSMAGITQNRQVAYFHCTLSIRVKQEREKKDVENICLMIRKIFFMIAKA